MGVGFLQLSSFSNIDVFLTSEPQISFFKKRYKRHTDFASKISKQSFSNPLDFGERSSADISKNENLLGEVTLVIDLPEIPFFKTSNGEIDKISKFAWSRNIGYRIINNIELVIDNQTIDRQYGELMKIQADLSINKNINNVIGNVKEVTTFTNGKQSYRLLIPLMFWFNKNSKSYLPLLSMNNNPITLRVELNPINKCCILSPSHYIDIDDDFVNFVKGEYIIQTINGIQSIGKFEYYDYLTRKLYYLKITEKGFESLIVSDPTTIQNESDRDLLLYKKNTDGSYVNEKYFIYGYTTKTYVMPNINSTEIIHRHTANIDNIKLNNPYLLVEHIYLNKKEQELFKRKTIECSIEQVMYSGESKFDGITQNIPVVISGSCKELIWISQIENMQNTRINQWDNYTDSFLTNENEEYIGKNIIVESGLLYSGSERVSFRNSMYFDTLVINEKHKYSKFKTSPINIFSFALEPENSTQPTGSANFSELENVSLKLRIDSKETINIRTYAVTHNILRFEKGIASLLFSNDLTL